MLCNLINTKLILTSDSLTPSLGYYYYSTNICVCVCVDANVPRVYSVIAYMRERTLRLQINNLKYDNKRNITNNSLRIVDR